MHTRKIPLYYYKLRSHGKGCLSIHRYLRCTDRKAIKIFFFFYNNRKIDQQIIWVAIFFISLLLCILYSITGKEIYTIAYMCKSIHRQNRHDHMDIWKTYCNIACCILHVTFGSQWSVEHSSISEMFGKKTNKLIFVEKERRNVALMKRLFRHSS